MVLVSCVCEDNAAEDQNVFYDCSTHDPIPLVSLSPDIVVVFHLLLETLWISGSHHWCMACTIPQALRMWAFQDCQSFFYPHVSQNLPIAIVIGQILPSLKMVAKGPDAIVITGQILTCLKMVGKGGCMCPKNPPISINSSSKVVSTPYHCRTLMPLSLVRFCHAWKWWGKEVACNLAMKVVRSFKRWQWKIKMGEVNQ